jgi:3-dehydroquinate synthase
MTTASFTIQDRTFECELYDDPRTAFTVRSTPRDYGVRFSTTDDPLSDVAAILAENERNLLLIDENVHRLYCAELRWPAERVFRAPATEAFKTLEGVQQVLDFLARNGLTKSEKLVVVGGGIIQDIGAFAAAMFKRGVPWVLFPTTLLAQCDSCIGAKAGVNYGNAKNQLGLFSAPIEVVVHPRFLATLTDADLRSGMGEVLKLHFTGGPVLVERLRALLSTNDVLPLVSASLAVKRAVIEADEFESDLRRSLNYGHTIGHALEAISNYAIPHGTAVTIGMLVVNRWSVQRGLFSEAECRSLEELAQPLVDSDARRILRSLNLAELGTHLRKDKKTTGGAANLVVLERIGQIRFVKVALDAEFTAAIAAIIEGLCSPG